MTRSVSDMSNAELDLLLKELFADGETMNDRLPSLDQPVDDLACSLMDTEEVTDADDETTTLQDKVRLLESQLMKAICKIDQLADQILVLQKENEVKKKESNTNCDNEKEAVNDITEHSRPEHDVAVTKPDTQDRSVTSNKRGKCRKENRGYCRQKNCVFRHPKMTCQMYSSMGYCNNEIRCEYRHPKTICYAWQSYRECKHGDRCRHRHPVNVISSPENPSTFLWAGLTNQQAAPPQTIHPSQVQSQYSQRENRW